MNRRHGAPPADDEIQAFVEELELGVVGTLCIRSVSRDILSVVLRTFHTTLDLEDYDAELTKHAMLLEDAWNGGERLDVSEVTQFIAGRGLDPEAIAKLTLLPESLTGLVVRSFNPKGNRKTWSASFVAHAGSIERAWSCEVCARTAPYFVRCAFTHPVTWAFQAFLVDLYYLYIVS